MTPASDASATAKLSSPPRDRPIGLLILLLVAAALYVLMLVSAAEPLAQGDAVVGQAIASVAVTFFLWVVLAIMLIAGGIGGAMPRWAAFLAVVLVPMSGVAAVVAIDMCSRHMPAAILFPAVLPVLIAFYAFWARLTRWHARWPPQPTSTAIWASVFVLSILTFMLAA